MKKAIQFSNHPILKTERLVLRKIEAQDHVEFLEILEYRTNGKPLTGVAEMMVIMEDQYKEGVGITWGMYFDDELIGTCGYYRGFANKSGEVGFVMREKFRKKGLMNETLRAVIDYGYNGLNLEMITAYTKDINLNALSLLDKLGFQKTEEFHEDYRKYELPVS